MTSGHQMRISDSSFRDLRRHLFQGERENVAFLFGRDSGDEGRLMLDVEGMYLVQNGEFDYQSAYHVALSDEALAKVIKTAWDLRAVPVEVHSHRSHRFPAAFSSSDFWGFRETVPHVRWRLRGAPYVALVIAPTGLDALVWAGESDEPEPMERLMVGPEAHIPTGISYARLVRDDG